MNPDSEPTGLAGTDFRIASLEGDLARQRGHVHRLAQDGLNTAVAATVLEAGEAVLKSFRAYRKLLLSIPTR